MSYTSFSIGTPGRAWDGIEFGSPEWNELFTKQMGILEAAGAETVASGYSAAIGKWVNINTYPSLEANLKVIAELSASQLFEIENSGPFVDQVEMMGMMMGS
tara:strand:+ start:290 stop:595 length:306 start_codon:yes stop_codon:yes gene_type:complete